MSRIATPLTTWSIKYYETRAIAERTLFDIRTAKSARPGGPFSNFWLASLFRALNRFLAKLLSDLASLERQPPTLLLDASGATLPSALRELFHTTADVLRGAREEGLDRIVILRRAIAQFSSLHERLVGFAERLEKTQQELRSRMAAERTDEDHGAPRT
jgi:hypothetical protein